jgi:TatD DNase family protein
MIDAHCHLLHLLGRLSLDAIEKRARSVGIERIITCTCSVKDWSDSSIFSGNQFFFPQFGIHPWWAGEERPADWLDQLRAVLLANPNSGVGEIGIDKNKAKRGVVTMPVQIETFKAQLRLASDLKRTATIHCVNAYGTLVDILREEAMYAPGGNVVLHSFSGSGDHVRELLGINLKIYFSVSGHCPRTEVISFIPIEDMLLESDSPSMPIAGPVPESVGGIATVPPLDDKTNDPSQLLHVLERVAKATNLPYDVIREKTRSNTVAAFSLV